jgi:hypothetical protein
MLSRSEAYSNKGYVGRVGATRGTLAQKAGQCKATERRAEREDELIILGKIPFEVRKCFLDYHGSSTTC